MDTLFGRGQAEGVSTGWQDGAVLADGSYSFINQNERMVHVAALPHGRTVRRQLPGAITIRMPGSR